MHHFCWARIGGIEREKGDIAMQKVFWDENDERTSDVLIDASLQPIDDHDVQQQKQLLS